MASQEVLLALQNASSSQDKPRVYKDLVSSLHRTTVSAADVKALVNSIFENTLGIVSTRALLVKLLSLLEIQSNDLKLEVGAHILGHLSSQSASFEEQNAQIRELMASAYESDDDFLDAANILAGISLDSSQRKVSPNDKAKVWIRITRNFLEVDDTTSAETYLNKTKNLIHQIGDSELIVHFQLSQARVQDARRDFLAAAKGYQDISLISNLAEEERLHTLSMAIKCAVLAPAGPVRSRTLKRLVKDERTSTLEEWGILEKMFFDRLIAPEEVAKFAEGLAPHQRAKTGDGSTVLVKAMGEHNLLGASRLYNNIGFDELGHLLGVDGEKAEEMTARMIEQGRLVGRIDQIERMIFFERGDATGEKGSGRSEGLVGRELRRWDANVQGLAEEVEVVATQLQMAYPVSGTAPDVV